MTAQAIRWMGTALLLSLLVSPSAAVAQASSGGDAAQAQPARDPLADRIFNPAEPDFTLVTLPTNLRMPAGRFAFRLTHRFSRPLDGGPRFGNLLEDFFGFDSAAAIGLELRYGLMPGTQVGLQRGNNKVLQLFGRQSVLSERDGRPLGLDAMVTVEGRNNFRDEYSGVVTVIVSKQVDGRAAVYVEPTWVGNVNKSGAFHVQIPSTVTDDDTFMLGLGARVRVRPTVFVVGEFVPRITGFDLGSDFASFAIEKRAGGHLFQLNFSNSLGVTPVLIAQGASEDDWFIGFNITRKFF